MQKFIGAALLLFIISALNTKAFARSLNCSFKSPETSVAGIKSIQIHDESLVINNSMVIALEHSKIKCGSFGRQNRFDGSSSGIQIILKSCSDTAALVGHLIDNESVAAVDIVCY